jgi:hypothetical protein
MKDCDYVLKHVLKQEAEFATELGKAGLSPLIIDSFQCPANWRLIIGEKMDGDLTPFFYPPKQMDEIMPQVFDILYRMVVDYNIVNYDIKINNFLWKKTDTGLKIYITDCGLATKPEENIKDNPKVMKKYLKPAISNFNNSFVHPGLRNVTSAPEMEKDDTRLSHPDWVAMFIKSENQAFLKDHRWSSLFDSVKDFDYGSFPY